MSLRQASQASSSASQLRTEEDLVRAAATLSALTSGLRSASLGATASSSSAGAAASTKAAAGSSGGSGNEQDPWVMDLFAQAAATARGAIEEGLRRRGLAPTALMRPPPRFGETQLLSIAVHDAILRGGVSGAATANRRLRCVEFAPDGSLLFDSEVAWPNILPPSLSFNQGDGFFFSYAALSSGSPFSSPRESDAPILATVKMAIMGNSLTVQIVRPEPVAPAKAQTIYLSVKDYVSAGAKGIKPSMISRLDELVESQILARIFASAPTAGPPKSSLMISESSAASLAAPSMSREDMEAASSASSAPAKSKTSRDEEDAFMSRPQGTPSLLISQSGPRIGGGGDFRGDLMPGGSAGSGLIFQDPFGGNGGGGFSDGGMLMGPGHPMFTGGMRGLPPGVPPGARFDPYTPFTPSPAVPFPTPNLQQKKKSKKPPSGGDFTTGDPDSDDFPPPGYYS